MVDSCWLLPLFLLSLIWVVWAARCCQPIRSRGVIVYAPHHRLLKPRTPEECPACRQHALQPLARLQPPPLVRPWCEVKSRRGAPKRISTEGLACPIRTCAYYRITDAQVHALVGDGRHGKHQRIQTFRCQAGGVTCTARRDTPLAPA